LEIPRAALTNGAMLLVNLLFVGVLYKELKITSFDPDLATTMGINAGLMHYVLMALVAATTIAAFESVGSILVIAMLIVPGACAHLLTDRLPVMLALSLLISALSAVLGHWSAIALPPLIGFRDTGTAGMMATAAGIIFFLIFLLAPRHGVAGRWLNRNLLALQIDRDDILGFLYRHRELAPEGTPPVKQIDLAGALLSKTRARLASWDLARRGLIRRQEGGLRLTAEGLKAAKNLIRSHRLWEAYLCEKMGFCDKDVHYTAHRLEHFTDSDMQARLDEAAGKPQNDPHQRKIPEAPQ
jgi:manganese/zinc/iron transport system permease protein